MSNKKNKMITEDEVLDVICDVKGEYKNIDAEELELCCFTRAKFACEKHEDKDLGLMARQLIQMAENLIYGF